MLPDAVRSTTLIAMRQAFADWKSSLRLRAEYIVAQASCLPASDLQKSFLHFCAPRQTGSLLYNCVVAFYRSAGLLPASV
jgi:hypothetical protein